MNQTAGKPKQSKNAVLFWEESQQLRERLQMAESFVDLHADKLSASCAIRLGIVNAEVCIHGVSDWRTEARKLPATEWTHKPVIEDQGMAVGVVNGVKVVFFVTVPTPAAKPETLGV